MQTGPAGITSGLPGNVFERLNGNSLKGALVNGRRSRPVLIVEKDVSRLCLDWASNLENADSARRCRFRNSQQKRASDLDPTYVWIPKLPHKVSILFLGARPQGPDQPQRRTSVVLAQVILVRLILR